MDLKNIIVDNINIKEISKDDLYNNIEQPKDKKNGDFSIPCFKFSKIFKKSPKEIADYFLLNFNKNKYIEKIDNVNGFLNIKLNNKNINYKIIKEILDKKTKYGSDNSGENKNICIDYSSINIAKNFHIGHLLSTVIGGVLYKTYKFLNYNPIGINHLGDWGTQFGALITAFKKWGNIEEVKKEKINILNKYYVKFHKEEYIEQKNIAKKLNITDEKEIKKIITPLREEARFWFKKIEELDKETLSIFNLFKEITLNEINKIYKKLSINFDYYTGESFYNDKMQDIIIKLNKKNLLKESKGLKIVEFLDENKNEIMPPAIIQKSDGTSLYLTRDLAAVYYRKKEFNFDKMLYIVGNQQILHFKQLIEIIKLLGEDFYKKIEHIPFGLISFSEGAMSTRNGNVILLKDVLKNSVQKSLDIIKDKNIKNKNKIAKQIGIGAVIFFALKNSRIKDIVFDYDKILNFDGETSPYIQYTYVRCISLIKKNNYKNSKIKEIKYLNSENSKTLILKLSEFNSILKNVINKNEPSILSRYLLDVAKCFNKFYNEEKIINNNKNETNEKILLVKCVKIVLKNGLNLLGIECPNQM